MKLYADTVTEQLECWDSGKTIWTIECGGLGPGYEQAIQLAAIEFARACKDLPGMLNNDQKSSDIFKAKCKERLREIDDALLGLSGAQFGAAVWLAWQWCFNGGPARLIERAKEQGKEDQVIQASKEFPHLP